MKYAFCVLQREKKGVEFQMRKLRYRRIQSYKHWKIISCITVHPMMCSEHPALNYQASLLIALWDFPVGKILVGRS